MAKGLDIRRRIKSIKSTRSITKAMQMVAASKMRKAQEQALKTRSYAFKSLQILAAISEKLEDYSHYLLTKTKGHRSLVLVITSNKGLCGSLNTNLIRKVIDFTDDMKIKYPELNELAEPFHFVTIGKKGRDTLFRLGHKVVADFSDISETQTFLKVVPMIRYLFDKFQMEGYDRIYLAYNHFISVLNQKPIIKRLLPLGSDLLDDLSEVFDRQSKIESSESSYGYVFEPSPAEVLEDLIPRLVEMQAYQSLLESQASEHSARMVAMKNATEAAGDLIDDLTLTFNKARQSSITQEIAEIVGGAEALKK
ncbi:MAG: ATP synthase F1 subunit gamma [Candidatus Peregrinibacteria bacterium]